MFSRRDFLASALAGAYAPLAGATSPQPILAPEMFGAAGDGASNDTAAFSALAERINAARGGTIMLKAGRTYVLGSQHRGGNRAFAPSPLLELHGLSRPLAIRGNGARLTASKNLRYGAFDPANGMPAHRPPLDLDESLIASPYWAMILIRACSGPVLIRDVELNGNAENLSIGGKWGDGGWQVPGSGLHLLDNVNEETVENVFSHHHPLDGAMISGHPERTGRSRISRLNCSYNGRQGLSFTGGRGYDFSGCDFAHTGGSALSSAPGAGVDLEAEDNKLIRDLTFTRCRFRDNAGSGMGADGGNTAGVRFSECEFVGSRNWSAWPRKPGFRFDRCTFAGAVVHAYPSADPRNAAQFRDCRFTDDPAFSSRGQLYFSGGAAGAVVDLDDSRNVLFERCRFDLRMKGVLPWTTRATYHDCTMRQHSRTMAMTRGRYLGRSTIEGPVSLYGSMIAGELILNGKLLPRGPVGSGVPRW